MFWKVVMLLGGFLSVGWMLVMFGVFSAEMYAPYALKQQGYFEGLRLIFLVQSQMFLQIGLAATIITLFPIVARKFN